MLVWSVVQALLSPFYLYKKLRRHFVKDYEWELDLRRWRVPTLAPDVPPARIVLVGAGPGELVMLDRLVEALEARRPDVPVGICLRNLDTLAVLRQERPTRRLSLWPFDALPPIARWLRAERPELLVFVDRLTERNLPTAAARTGAMLALANGRSRRRESTLYRLCAPFYLWRFGGYRLMAMQNEEEIETARRFAPPECTVIDVGSLKADLRRRGMSQEAREDLERWLCPDALPLVAVGSTSDPEEEAMVLDAYIATRDVHPCRLLLAPRDVRRCGSTLQLIAARGLSVSRRSEREEIADVLLLDTFGELATAYASCRAAYVGDFWRKGGGHNVLEPLEWGVPVAYGPHPRNFATERAIAEAAGAGFPLDGPDALRAFWLRFLRDDEERKKIGAAGQAALDRSRGAFDRTADALLKVLDEGAGRT